MAQGNALGPGRIKSAKPYKGAVEPATTTQPHANEGAIWGLLFYPVCLSGFLEKS
jgi:hypothetical protein